MQNALQKVTYGLYILQICSENHLSLLTNVYSRAGQTHDCLQSVKDPIISPEFVSCCCTMRAWVSMLRESFLLSRVTRMVPGTLSAILSAIF